MYDIGEKVFVKDINDTYYGTVCTIENIKPNKYSLVFNDMYIGDYNAEQISADKQVSLNDILTLLNEVELMKDDESYYDYEEEYFGDDEYIGWRNAVEIFREKIINRFCIINC